MARFPRNDSEITGLASTLISGLETSVEIYPAPPAAPAELTTAMEAFEQCKHAAVAAAAAAEAATAAKLEAMAELVLLMKRDIRYAENEVDFQDDKLKLLGWSAPRASRRTQPPGQPLSLKIVLQTEESITLSWSPPSEGGKPAMYKILRRQGDSDWQEAGSSLTTRCTLSNQPRSVDLEYRIVSVNHRGESPPTNTVRVTL